MKRVIKFRAWIKTPKECYMAIQGTPDLEDLQSFIFHYGDKELMQFTGLLDKNKIEIYEGDILKFKDCSFDENEWISIVRFENGSFNVDVEGGEYNITSIGFIDD